MFRSNEMISCPHCMKMAVIAFETVDEMFDDMNHREQNDVFIDVYDEYSGVDTPLYDAKNRSDFVLKMTRLPHLHNYRDQHNYYDQYSKYSK